jgi:hypothetical protein
MPAPGRVHDDRERVEVGAVQVVRLAEHLGEAGGLDGQLAQQEDEVVVGPLGPLGPLGLLGGVGHASSLPHVARPGHAR